MTRLVIISGPPGVGKTTVAQLLADSLDGVAACVSGDVFLLAVTPFEASDDRRAFLRDNLASFARHAVAHAYDWIVIECVIPSDEFISGLIGDIGLAAENVTVVSLLADRGVYEKRVRDKLRSEGGAEIDLSACHEWMKRIAALRIPTSIDSSAETPRETLASLKRIIGTED